MFTGDLIQRQETFFARGTPVLFSHDTRLTDTDLIGSRGEKLQTNLNFSINSGMEIYMKPCTIRNLLKPRINT